MGGERDRIRTCDPVIKSHLLYQLSYAPDILTEYGKSLATARYFGDCIIIRLQAVYTLIAVDCKLLRDMISPQKRRKNMRSTQEVLTYTLASLSARFANFRTSLSPTPGRLHGQTATQMAHP